MPVPDGGRSAGARQRGATVGQRGYLTCWAVNPSGTVYGYNFFTPALQTIDPATGVVTAVGPLPKVGQRSCSCSFSKENEMLLSCKSPGIPNNPPLPGETDMYYTVDVSAPAATLVNDAATPLGAGDMASCPFGPAPGVAR